MMMIKRKNRHQNNQKNKHPSVVIFWCQPKVHVYAVGRIPTKSYRVDKELLISNYGQHKQHNYQMILLAYFYLISYLYTSYIRKQRHHHDFCSKLYAFIARSSGETKLNHEDDDKYVVSKLAAIIHPTTIK